MFHISLYHFKRVRLNHLAQESDAFTVGGDLCFQVRQVIGQSPRSCPGQYFRDTRFLKLTILHQFKCFDADSLFYKGLRKWRHGARCAAANIGVVSAAGNKKDCSSFLHNRSDDRDIRKVASPGCRMVGDPDLPLRNGMTI